MSATSPKIDDGGPAFPRTIEVRTVNAAGDLLHAEQYPGNGMSLRDWFAGQALAGLYASDENETCDPSKPIEPQLQAHAEAYAKAAYRAADAMIAAKKAGGAA